MNELFTHEGVTYRKVNRKANVGEKVLITGETFDDENNVGNIFTVINALTGSRLVDTDGKWNDGSTLNIYPDEYVTLEPIAETEPLTLTEADIRNNPRQVIDLLANMALRLTKLEERVEYVVGNTAEIVNDIDGRINRLASANEQAMNLVASNVETWAQEHEVLKRKVADLDERTLPYQVAHELFVKIAGGLPRGLTAEERREL